MVDWCLESHVAPASRVQISLSRKTFCSNLGGFAKKFRNVDATMYGLLAANTGARGTSSTRQTPPFHVLAYIDDLYGDFDIFYFFGERSSRISPLCIAQHKSCQC